jgi:WD40 repeat protein
MPSISKLLSMTILALAFSMGMNQGLRAEDVSFEDANKIFTKYCAGCHNADDANGEFALDTFEALVKGGENGKAMTAGSAASSRMVLMMRGKLEPTMPPEGEAFPSADEIQMVADWIDGGAKGPSGESGAATKLDTPTIKSTVDVSPITALAFSKDGKKLAVGRFGSIEIRSGDETIRTIKDLPGKVTSLSFLQDDSKLIAGTGVAGLYGEAILFQMADGSVKARFRNHRDIVYSVAVSNDEKWLATAGYDRKSVLWKVDSNKPVREFVGHNDAVFQNAFDSTGDRLVTASADATVKVWRTSDAMRLDTRGEPLKEQYAVAISPDGKHFVGGGEDNRIRKWELISSDPDQTNPLALARFAHKAAIEILRFHPMGKHLVSVGSDGEIKIWDNATLTQRHLIKNDSGVQAFDVCESKMAIGMMSGQLKIVDWPKEQLSIENRVQSKIVTSTKPDVTQTGGAIKVMEAPFKTDGAIKDLDQQFNDFAFHAIQGERWIIEAKADKDSPIDTQISILDSDHQPVPRVLLRAVRDSYFTFRGKNSTQADDFRVFNWEEMKLNQLLYCNGEVVRLYHYPRGPDSGYNVYPNYGKRQTMFDTTAIAHALQEPCFVVEAHPPGSQFPATGLPQFLLNYENDDDGQRELGTNSRLTFTAPSTNDFVVRVRDARGFHGDDYKYELAVRRESPSFKIRKIVDDNPTLMRGGFKRMGVEIDRIDNFAGEVNFELKDLPKGLTASGPFTIEANALRAFFTVRADDDFEIDSESKANPEVVATANIDSEIVSQTVPFCRELKLDKTPKLFVGVKHPPKTIPHFDQSGLPVFEIFPGQTIEATVTVKRNGHNERINFGKEEAAVNLPFGVYVDNTGLNGVLITPKQTERTFQLTAEDWVKPCERVIFLVAEEAGKPASSAAVLRVLPAKSRKVAVSNIGS